MKRILIALAIMLSLLAIPGVYAGVNSIACAGNTSSSNYTTGDAGTLYITVTQLNSSVSYNQRAMFQDQINISTNGTVTEGVTLTELNYTLGDTWAYNSISDIELLNSTGNLIQECNETYADGSYLKCKFNATNLATNANSYGAIMNSSTENTTFYIRYLIATIDSKKLLTQSTSGTHYDDRIIYQTPSDLDVENITVTYVPSVFSNIDVFKTVSWNGTALSRGTSGNAYMQTTTGIQVIETKTFLNGTNNTFNMTYTTGESSGSHGGTGAGRSRPSGTVYQPTYPSYNPFQAIIEFFKRLFGLR